jgi:hypothetical protein
MFPDSFMDDVTYVGDFEVWVVCMICNICYSSENFGLGSLHDDVGFAGVTPQFYSVVSDKFDYRFVY